MVHQRLFNRGSRFVDQVALYRLENPTHSVKFGIIVYSSSLNYYEADGGRRPPEVELLARRYDASPIQRILP